MLNRDFSHLCRDMKIKVTIKSDSKASKVLKKYISEKEAFKQAVRTGNVTEFIKQNQSKLDSSVRVK